MSRKKRNSKDANIDPPAEPVQSGEDLTEPTPHDGEANLASLNSAQTNAETEGEMGDKLVSTEGPGHDETNAQQETPAGAQAEESPSDDPLDFVRRSMMEEEQKKSRKRPRRWWRKLAGDSQGEEEASGGAMDKVEPAGPPEARMVEKQQEVEKTAAPEENGAEIDELIEALNISEPPAPAPATQEESAEEKIAKAVDIAELKKQALQPRPDAGRRDVTDEVRSIALQDGEEVLVEVQATRQDTLEERVSGIENALRPYRRYIYAGFAVLGALMVAITAILLYVIYQRLQPPPPVEVLDLPYPTMINLPGGLGFNLQRGELNDGQWNPQGPEWLEGTELCRWVAIPWSLQMEAVIRTLNPDDPIELTMSNNDQFTYRVYSVREVNVDELQDLDTATPCLLVILAKADSDTRWVLTALP